MLTLALVLANTPSPQAMPTILRVRLPFAGCDRPVEHVELQFTKGPVELPQIARYRVHRDDALILREDVPSSCQEGVLRLALPGPAESHYRWSIGSTPDQEAALMNDLLSHLQQALEASHHHWKIHGCVASSLKIVPKTKSLFLGIHSHCPSPVYEPPPSEPSRFCSSTNLAGWPTFLARRR